MIEKVKKCMCIGSLARIGVTNDYRATFIKGDMYIRDMKHTAYDSSGNCVMQF